MIQSNQGFFPLNGQTNFNQIQEVNKNIPDGSDIENVSNHQILTSVKKDLSQSKIAPLRGTLKTAAKIACLIAGAALLSTGIYTSGRTGQILEPSKNLSFQLNQCPNLFPVQLPMIENQITSTFDIADPYSFFSPIYQQIEAQKSFIEPKNDEPTQTPVLALRNFYLLREDQTPNYTSYRPFDYSAAKELKSSNPVEISVSQTLPETNVSPEKNKFSLLREDQCPDFSSFRPFDYGVHDGLAGIESKENRSDNPAPFLQTNRTSSNEFTSNVNTFGDSLKDVSGETKTLTTIVHTFGQVLFKSTKIVEFIGRPIGNFALITIKIPFKGAFFISKAFGSYVYKSFAPRTSLALKELAVVYPVIMVKGYFQNGNPLSLLTERVYSLRVLQPPIDFFLNKFFHPAMRAISRNPR